jgi:uncharacterized protein (TIGR04255 family)
MNRDRTRNITLTGEWIAVETSRYERYERFAEEIDWVLERVHPATPLPAVTRIGLRYIDEIQIEGTDALEDWKAWINPDLIVGGVIDGYDTKDYLAQMLLEVDDQRRLTIRYGRVSAPVVDPNGPLKVANSPVGPYFLLDIDSFWEAPADAFEEFDAAQVREESLRLHEPVRDIFERAITTELRNHFLEGASA